MFFVRSASERDLKAVSALLATAWHATYDVIYGRERVEAITREWHSLAALKRDLARPASEFLVADSGRELGGTAYASVTAKDVVTLHRLYIDPRMQRQGVGSDLLAEIESCFDGARTLRLEVEPANSPAVAFYRARGFMEAGQVENCGSSDSAIPAIVMEKALA
jgi:ribosomal protein S18 acetylase RimI-like enzyme